MNKLLFTLLVFYSSFAFSQYRIYTIAGDSVSGFAGDNTLATDAELNFPVGVAIDAMGNIYIADEINNRVRKVSPGGIITSIAGNGKPGFAGDGGPATAAKLSAPTGVAVDTLGNIYIADYDNNRIRKINTSGVITTIAGDSIQGFAGDSGAATAAELYTPTDIAIDNSGNLYISDYYNQRIRKVNTSGIITTIAGNGAYGFAGDSGAAIAAVLSHPTGVAVDHYGNIYIADQNNNRIRMVNTIGIITTIAGNGTSGFAGDNGPATNAELNWPADIVVDNQSNIYVTDNNNQRIRMVNTNGIINTIAGNGTKGFSGDTGPASAAELYSPVGVAVDGYGYVYFADQGNNRVRMLWIIEGINEISNDAGSVITYPNPSNGIFNIALQNPTRKYNVIVYNMLGQEVFSVPLNSTTSQIDLSNNPTGLYLYRVISKDGNILGSGKLVKE